LLDSQSQNAAAIEINGHYHTSLQAGSYSEVCLAAPTRALVSTRMAELQQAVKNDADATKILELQPTQVFYLRVTERSDGGAKLDLVGGDTATKDLQQTSRQLHAASRVPNAGSCVKEDWQTVKASHVYKEIETIGLEVDALFSFGKADAHSLSNSGSQALKTLVDQLHKKYATLDNVHLQITGYADPLGNSLLNERLSEQRAKTIYDYMVAAGINTNKLSYEGKGATDLVAKECSRVMTPESIKCNKPNRRVVVNVSTLKQ
jgi:OmpA-OmpF porin, OOP family